MKQSEKTNVLFPIEISNRELDFRLFLASYCAREDVRIFIGQTNAIYRLAKNIENGIYVGKNIRPPRIEGSMMARRHAALRQQGFRLVHLDEEGGVMKGDHERWRKWLRLRLNPTALDERDYLCTWGEWQREFYLSQQPRCAANTFVTGHPRFDLYKPHLRAFYAEEARKLQQRWGDFVLINTNFAWANNRNGIGGTFSSRMYYDGAADVQRRLDHVSEWANNSRILVAFVELVSHLSASRPDLQFVVRPHPSENIGFYQAVFGGVSNVQVIHEGSVGSWLLACRALIHDGCTTGLEAHIAGACVINFKPFEDARFELWLPNLFGEKCKSHEDVQRVLAQTQPRQVAAIGEEKEGASRGGATGEAEEQARKLIANFGLDSFVALRDVVWKAVDAQKDDVTSRYAARRHGAFEAIRNVSRAVQTRRRDASRLDKFAPLSQAGLEKRMEAVCKLRERKLTYRVLSEELMCVETP
jgi:surface carbohydrate biosynthesis protein